MKYQGPMDRPSEHNKASDNNSFFISDNSMPQGLKQELRDQITQRDSHNASDKVRETKSVPVEFANLNPEDLKSCTDYIASITKKLEALIALDHPESNKLLNDLHDNNKPLDQSQAFIGLESSPSALIDPKNPETRIAMYSLLNKALHNLT